MDKPIAKLMRLECACGGAHYVNLFDTNWDTPEMGFYACNTCRAPLVVRDDLGRFYLVGRPIDL